jgi:predicted PurR-regulated permease PerM
MASDRTVETRGRRRIPSWVIVAIVASVFLVLVFAIAPEVPFILFAGVLLALFVQMPAAWLSSKTNLPDWLSSAIVWIAVLAMIALGAWAIGADVTEQLRQLSQRWPIVARKIEHWLEHPPAWTRQFVDPPNATSLRPDPSTVVPRATDAVLGASALLGSLVVVFFIGFYGSLAPRSYTRVVVGLAPPSAKARVERVLGDMGQALGRWLLGRFVAMTFVGVFTGIGLHWLGIPGALGLGIVAGVLTFVEYLGAVVSAIPAGIVAITVGPMQVVWVVLLYLVVHIIEGYLLTPLIARAAVRIPPAYTLAGQLALGGLFGVLGLTFATPLAVIVVILVQALRATDVRGARAA